MIILSRDRKTTERYSMIYMTAVIKNGEQIFCSIWFGQCVRASKVMKNISNRWSGILRNLNISICIHLELRQKILHFTESGR